MTLRLRHLRMRAMTSGGLYGADIPFHPGLNVIWADNTKGKSTCMQGMLYALGMERMLSPRRTVPLPHAMTEYLRNNDDSTEKVLESGVSLELQNGAGQIITLHRIIKHDHVDNRLINVDFGPALTEPNLTLERKSFFTFDPGSAQRIDGFHYFLEDFLGWTLPHVRYYDKPEGKLYLETVFPLFWVEQKAGWSAIPAAIPTYLRVREVQKRAVEFIMDLDVHKLELQRQRIQEQIIQNAKNWQSLWDEMDRVAKHAGAAIEGLPQIPTILPDELTAGRLLIARKGEWLPISDILSEFRTLAAKLRTLEVPTIESTADDLTEELNSLNAEVDRANRTRVEFYKARQLKDANITSLERRIKSLKEDMQKNQDVQKLQRYSGRTAALTPNRCPTCEQTLVDSLISQEVLSAVMPIEDNIEYIRSQLKMFENILSRELDAQRKIEIRAFRADREIVELYSKIRAIREELVRPGGNPSAAAIEERVRLESRIRDLDMVNSLFMETIEHMKNLVSIENDLRKELSSLPSEKLSPLDQDKIRTLTGLLQQRAGDFGFSTFDPAELSINEDSYRPQNEGYEIGFETSASDAIRLKWAYQLGLLELGHYYSTNHPGFLLLDEPRQQSSSKVSFGRFLECAAARERGDDQIIVSTSEDLLTLQDILGKIRCHRKIFEGYVISPIR